MPEPQLGIIPATRYPLPATRYPKSLHRVSFRRGFSIVTATHLSLFTFACSCRILSSHGLHAWNLDPSVGGEAAKMRDASAKVSIKL
jgi:hypothetical protein